MTVTPPSGEPITLTEAKAHLNLDGTDRDTELAALIAAARDAVESSLGLRLVEQTVDWVLDGFCGMLVVPLGPVRSVTSIKYFDTAGVEQTLSASLYQADVRSEPARILPVFGQVWPQTDTRLAPVTVRLAIGYATGAGSDYGANVPPAIKHAIKLMLGHLFANREAVAPGARSELPMGVAALLAPYRFPTGFGA